MGRKENWIRKKKLDKINRHTYINTHKVMHKMKQKKYNM